MLRGAVMGWMLVATLALADEPADKVMGNWQGQWKTDEGQEGKLAAKIAALGDGKYKGVMIVTNEEGESVSDFSAESADGKATCKGKHGEGEKEVEWTGSIEGETFTIPFKGKQVAGTAVLKRVELKSPTLGQSPPDGAVVLFDGANLDKWKARNGNEAGWTVEGGVARIKPGTGDIVAKDPHGAIKLHVEFRTPFMPKARGQGRGNSGVYLQGRYEVQVLDSFGEPARDNEAGGLYSVATPKKNASLPPGEWQTYDITFHPPTYDGDTLKTPAKLTVVYNGEVIHDDVTVGKITPGGIASDMKSPGGLLLQDHGNLVEYRNIWYVPIKE